MKKIFITLLLLLLISCNKSTSNEAEDSKDPGVSIKAYSFLIDKGLNELDEMSSIIELVEDEKSAKDSAVKLKKIFLKFKETRKKKKSLGDPHPLKNEELEQKYELRIKESSERFVIAIDSLEEPYKPIIMNSLE